MPITIRLRAGGALLSLSIVNGYNNTAVGFSALYSDISGDENTAIGSLALLNAYTDGNTAVGAYSLLNDLNGIEIRASAGMHCTVTRSAPLTRR
jgi:hypothetical protein